MCGRTVFTVTRDRVGRVCDADSSTLPGTVDIPKYNQCPMTNMVTVVRNRESGVRELKLMRWGLEPKFQTSQHLNTINARVEGLRTSRLYKPLIDSKRCIVIVDGYYEWTQDTTPHQPYLIRYDDSVSETTYSKSVTPAANTAERKECILPSGVSPLFLAGLYDYNDSKREYMCTILTSDSYGPPAFIHSRMPMLLSPESSDVWLSDKPFDDVASVLVNDNRAMADKLMCTKVSPLVNTISNKSIEVTYPESEAKKRSFEKGLGRFFTKLESPKKLKSSLE